MRIATPRKTPRKIPTDCLSLLPLHSSPVLVSWVSLSLPSALSFVRRHESPYPHRAHPCLLRGHGRAGCCAVHAHKRHARLYLLRQLVLLRPLRCEKDHTEHARDSLTDPLFAAESHQWRRLFRQPVRGDGRPARLHQQRRKRYSQSTPALPRWVRRPFVDRLFLRSTTRPSCPTTRSAMPSTSRASSRIPSVPSSCSTVRPRLSRLCKPETPFLTRSHTALHIPFGCSVWVSLTLARFYLSPSSSLNYYLLARLFHSRRNVARRW
jgi:hypothetical protein